MLVAGCGSDDEPASKPAKPPELTIPETDPPQTTTETTESTETTPPPTTEQTTPTETTPPADTPQNDTPPPAGSPADKFESFCNDNPGACG